MDDDRPRRYKFAPMLGPAQDQPVGSFARAECFGNELEYNVEHVARAVRGLADVIRRVVAEQPQILAVFPARSLDEFLWRCSGMGEDNMTDVLHAFGFHDLCLSTGDE